MVADVSGFTKLTETLSKTGSAGVELLTNCINDYFGKVCLLFACRIASVFTTPILTATRTSRERVQVAYPASSVPARAVLLCTFSPEMVSGF